MREIRAYQTADGTIYPFFKQAEKHEDTMYGDALRKLAGAIANLPYPNHNSIMTLLDERMSEVKKLTQLKENTIFIPFDEDTY